MNGVSVTVGVFALIAAIILATVFNKLWPRVIAGLVITGAAGIVNGTYGPKVNELVTKLDRMIGNAIGTAINPGEPILGALGVVVVGVWIGLIYTKKIDNKTLALSAAVPVTLPVVPGGFGVAVTTIVGVIPWFFSGIIGWAFLGSWGG